MKLERRYWSYESRTWDRVLADDRARAHIDEMADWLSVTPVIDLGCGTGNYTAALVARGRVAVGVDFSAGMLAKAQGKGIATLVRGDIGRLPFPDGSFAGALSVYSVQFFDPRPFLAEVARVLKPGGVLLVEVPVGTGRSQARVAKRVASRLGVALGVARLHKEADLRTDLAANGFSVVERRDFRRSYALYCTNEQASPLGPSRL